MENNEQSSVFEVLNAVNCNEHVEKKTGLSYLSWAWAWAEVKKRFPYANFRVYEREDGRIYWDDGRTAWVKTGVMIEGLEHTEYLPIMDFQNVSIPVGRITSTDVNRAIQRGLTKACARHGLGLYIYAGEDLPEEEARKNTYVVDDPDDFFARISEASTSDELLGIWKRCSQEIRNNEACRNAVKEHPLNPKRQNSNGVGQ